MPYLEEVRTVASAMRKFGGSFVQSLGAALARADKVNGEKIHETWPEYWDKYLDLGRGRKEYILAEGVKRPEQENAELLEILEKISTGEGETR